MELQYYGGNCIRVSTKKSTIIIDDNLTLLGKKSITKDSDIELRTSNGIAGSGNDSQIFFNQPGEYEVGGVSIVGIAARAHMDEESKSSATIFRIEADDAVIAIIGHIYPELSEKQLETIGIVDVLIVPVGGNGYTLDPVGALKVIKKIEPKIVIPVHYDSKSLKYEVPQQPLEEALKTLAMEPLETVDKYKVKPSELSETTHLIVLKEQ